MRETSLSNYAVWYLEREARKSNAHCVQAGPEAAVQTMWKDHDGKMRQWFRGTTRWTVVAVDAAELADVVFLDCSWTRREGLVVPNGKNYRLLSRVAENARANSYFTRPPTDDRHAQHQQYYRALAASDLSLVGADRLALCTAEASEVDENPRARYYLLDGVGRGLPYMFLAAQGAMEGTAIEAFLAERGVA